MSGSIASHADWDSISSVSLCQTSLVFIKLGKKIAIIQCDQYYSVGRVFQIFSCQKSQVQRQTFQKQRIYSHYSDMYIPAGVNLSTSAIANFYNPLNTFRTFRIAKQWEAI